MTFIFILTFGLTLNSLGQDKECLCPSNKYAGTKPETIFHLTDGNDIALCGYAETKDNEKIYSEFVLASCGGREIIDFWGATTSCKIRVAGDTLIVEEIKYLPTSENLDFKSTIWTYEYLSFKNNEIKRINKVNKGIRKYSRAEIDQVNAEFENSTKFVDGLVEKLFIATISGDKKSRKYFIEYKTKFGVLDGHMAEDYKELTAMLKFWDNA